MLKPTIYRVAAASALHFRSILHYNSCIQCIINARIVRPLAMPSNQRKPRVPTLKYTKSRNIGWHVSFRDPESGTPRKHRFGMVSLQEAEKAYHEWVAAHLCGQTPRVNPKRRKKLDLQSVAAKPRGQGVPTEILPGRALSSYSTTAAVRKAGAMSACRFVQRAVSPPHDNGRRTWNDSPRLADKVAFERVLFTSHFYEVSGL